MYTPGRPTPDEKARLRPLSGWRWHLALAGARALGWRDRAVQWLGRVR